MPITHTPPSNPWFRIQPAAWPVRLRLFCFHHAGGAASAYRLWQAQLPAGIQVCAVQPPGRETRIREQPFTEMNGLVDACLQHMQPYLDPPFALFGHSMGSLVAYEVAQRLYRLLSPKILIGVTPVEAAVREPLRMIRNRRSYLNVPEPQHLWWAG